MSHEWLIQTLAEARDYAQQHGLSATALHVDEGLLLAMTELATREAQELAAAEGGSKLMAASRI